MLFVIGWLAWEMFGLWISDSYAPPYMKISLIILGLLLVVLIFHWEGEKVRLGHFDYKYKGLERDPYLVKWFSGSSEISDRHRKMYWRICGRTFYTILCLNLLNLLVASCYFDRTNIYWTVSDSSGSTLQNTSYPYWSSGFNATDPKKIDTFNWSGTLTRQFQIDSLNICEIELGYNYECDEIHDNVEAISETGQMSYAIIETLDKIYLPKIEKDARKMQGTCSLNEWRTVQTTFSASSINPKIKYTKDVTTCRYRFVSKV